jgi:hypothetical protein
MTNHDNSHVAAGLAVQRERWVCLDCRKMFRPYLAHGAVPVGRRAKAGTQHAPSWQRLPARSAASPFGVSGATSSHRNSATSNNGPRCAC